MIESCRTLNIVEFFAIAFWSFSFETFMTFFNFFKIFWRVWERVFRDATSNFSSFRLITSSFLSCLWRLFWDCESSFEFFRFSRISSVWDLMNWDWSFAIFVVNDSNVLSWFLSIFRRDAYREILIARHKLHLKLRLSLLWKRRKNFYEILFFFSFHHEVETFDK